MGGRQRKERVIGMALFSSHPNYLIQDAKANETIPPSETH